MKIPKKWVIGAFLLLMISMLQTVGASEWKTHLGATPSGYTDFSVMHRGTHSEQTESAVQQCKRNARHRSSDPLLLEHCNVLEQQLNRGQCRVEFVPNGVLFAFLNGKQHGKPVVYENQRKWIGYNPKRTDRALVCDLAPGVTAVWLTGERAKGKESCNNLNFLAWPQKPVAFIQTPPPPPVEIPAIELQDPEPPEEECRERETVSVGQAYGHGGEEALFLPGTPAWCPTGSRAPTLYVRPSEKGIKGGKITSADCY